MSAGRLDQLALNGARLAIAKGCRNLGLDPSLAERAWPEIQPACERLIEKHVSKEPITLVGLLESIGLLDKPAPPAAPPVTTEPAR